MYVKRHRIPPATKFKWNHYLLFLCQPFLEVGFFIPEKAGWYVKLYDGYAILVSPFLNPIDYMEFSLLCKAS